MGLEGSPSTGAGSSIPPWSAAHPYVKLYTHKNPIEATVVGNYRVTGDDTESDIRHIVLDFGTTPFPVLEGQSIAIFPPGTDSKGRPHHARQSPIASPRDGARTRSNTFSLTVKRVTTDYAPTPAAGLWSHTLRSTQKNHTVTGIRLSPHHSMTPNSP